jgi:3-methylcrotonyl-CoA carboxylase beta subunit
MVDPKEYIARIVDGSKFHEFKERYGTTLVTGFARIDGHETGIVANRGFLNSEASLKGAHFIELCNFRKIPIIFLQNITGFIVGKKYEHGGIARDGAKMVHAVANSVVPKITLITGGSFGAGNYAMNGRAFEPRFLFIWPNAHTGVMGGEQAADVMVTVKKNQLRKSGKELSVDEEMKIREGILTTYANENSAYYSTSRLWDDGIIDPADTRKVLGMALETVSNAEIPEPKSGIYRM